jgi:hypothetical protein
MAAAEQGPVANGLVERVKAIMFTPAETWDVIEAEPATIKGLYLGYACILAAIGPVARLIGSQVFGMHLLGLRSSLVVAVSSAVVSYVLGLVGVFVLALVIDALAPSFGATKNQVQAFKVAVYSSTAIWITQIFALLPPVSALAIIGIYSFYLLYLGLPKLMKAPADKAMPYFVAVIIVDIVIYAIIAACAVAMAGVGVGMMMV